jgi:lipopolysaccharide export system permease protein
MRKLDVYIIVKFLATFFFMTGIILALAIIFDIQEKLEDFIKTEAPALAIIRYYLDFSLYYGNLFSSLLIFLSVIYFTSKMASLSEIVAILSSGVSFNRMLFPYFIVASFLAIGSLFLNHWILPIANKSRLNFEEIYYRNPYRYSDKNIHKQIQPGEFIYMESFNNRKNTGYKFAWEIFDGTEMKYKLMADFITYDSTNNKWTLKNYVARTIDGYNETLKKGAVLDTTLALDIEGFQRRIEFVGSMNYNELNTFIDEQKMIGNEDVPYFLIEKHQRSSYPFATYILTLIGVSVASRKLRGGTGLHIAYGLVICVVYILAMKVTTVYALNAGLEPYLAVWIPNLLFVIIAGFMYRYAPK